MGKQFEIAVLLLAFVAVVCVDATAKNVMKAETLTDLNKFLHLKSPFKVVCYYFTGMIILWRLFDYHEFLQSGPVLDDKIGTEVQSTFHEVAKVKVIHVCTQSALSCINSINRLSLQTRDFLLQNMPLLVGLYKIFWLMSKNPFPKVSIPF
jgi:hypothetical protein